MMRILLNKEMKKFFYDFIYKSFGLELILAVIAGIAVGIIECH